MFTATVQTHTSPLVGVIDADSCAAGAEARLFEVGAGTVSRSESDILVAVGSTAGAGHAGNIRSIASHGRVVSPQCRYIDGSRRPREASSGLEQCEQRRRSTRPSV